MNTTIRVGIYRDDDAPWPFIRESLLTRGIEIELIPFCSLDVLNLALYGREIDLNFCQHLAYLENENAEHGYDLVALCKTILEPMGLYSNTRICAKDLQIGDQIVIPDDPSNSARALKILNDAGIIKTDPRKGYLPGMDDILENPLNLKFTKVNIESTLYSLENPAVAGAFVMGNLAFEAGLHSDRDAIVCESVGANPKVNPFFKVLVTRNADKDRKEFKEIIKLYQSDEATRILDNAKNGQLIVAKMVI